MKKRLDDKVVRTFRAHGQVLKEEKYPGHLVLIQEATSIGREGSYKCPRVYMAGKRMRACMWRGGRGCIALGVVALIVRCLWGLL